MTDGAVRRLVKGNKEVRASTTKQLEIYVITLLSLKEPCEVHNSRHHDLLYRRKFENCFNPSYERISQILGKIALDHFATNYGPVTRLESCTLAKTSHLSLAKDCHAARNPLASKAHVAR